MRITRPFFMLGVLASSLRADVTLAPLFTDHAVIQRDKPVPVWGKADPGERVSVSFREQILGATAGSDGRWIVFLDPSPANSEGADLLVTGKNSLSVHDVVVGEVWLCSGQSNMEFMLKQAANAPAEIATAHFPLIRHIKIARNAANEPVEAVATNGWIATTPETAGDFTAVGYFFAREVFRKLNVPIGLVNATWGGTPIEAWMSPAAFTDSEHYVAVTTRWSETVAAFPARKEDYELKLSVWNQSEAAAKTGAAAVYKTFLSENPKPRSPRGAEGDPWTPTSLFNGMINPLLPYALRGALWYQGESNADHAAEYRVQFAALITAWRAHFGQGDFPFYWVNLANYRAPGDTTNMTYALLREAQTQVLTLPNTGQALAIDVGNPDDVHPTNKQELGSRLAALAKNRVYGFIGDDTGPTFLRATREGAALRLRFTHASAGLIAYEKPVQSLEIAGANRMFYPATARIDRDTLLVSAPEVKEPVAVRYAWSNAPEANLYNGAGLPAVPFRSDNW